MTSLEIFSGLQLLPGLMDRIAAVPLLMVMIKDIIFSKIPIPSADGSGLWPNAARSGFAMTMMII